MAKYIVLINWTDKGVAEAKSSPERVDKARSLARQMGGDIEQIFLTMGIYDVVAILEMPSDEAVAELHLKSAAGGHIRTTTLKAFDEASFRKITGAL